MYAGLLGLVGLERRLVVDGRTAADAQVCRWPKRDQPHNRETAIVAATIARTSPTYEPLNGGRMRRSLS
jgi:hypothetical protein